MDDVCRYRLHRGWWPHAQILLLNWGNGLPQPQLSVLFLTVPGAPIFDDAAPAGSRCLLQFFPAGGISFAKCLEDAFWQKIGGPEYHDVSSR